jgi:hypothetical protein
MSTIGIEVNVETPGSLSLGKNLKAKPGRTHTNR